MEQVCGVRLGARGLEPGFRVAAPYVRGAGAAARDLCPDANASGVRMRGAIAYEVVRAGPHAGDAPDDDDGGNMTCGGALTSDLSDASASHTEGEIDA